jgi:hypothetical protein
MGLWAALLSVDWVAWRRANPSTGPRATGTCLTTRASPCPTASRSGTRGLCAAPRRLTGRALSARGRLGMDGLTGMAM